jgi:hypothetical protein
MARYVLDMTQAHKQSFIELVNNDNVTTIGSNLTLDDVNFVGERAVDPVAEAGIPRGFAVTLENSQYPKDKVTVFWNKLALGDVVTMQATDFQSWYDPDTWNAETSPADALPAFAAAALRANVDVNVAMENLVFTREYNSTENYYYMRVAGTSMVFVVDTLYRMPKHFSEIVTVTELNGFIYSPIAPEAVVE